MPSPPTNASGHGLHCGWAGLMFCDDTTNLLSRDVSLLCFRIDGDQQHRLWLFYVPLISGVNPTWDSVRALPGVTVFPEF